MKVQINKPRYNKYTTFCALVGHHDDNGNYCETVFENIKFKDLDKSIAENVYLDHDITLHIAPKCELRVFAKNMDDIHTYCETIDNLQTRKLSILTVRQSIISKPVKLCWMIILSALNLPRDTFGQQSISKNIEK